ncbi:MAG: hypothetical protein HY897_05600 [Deltaproteobacteria bacterium]|nr:hypothetical protein [Deltaproteobacteria bacterium]
MARSILAILVLLVMTTPAAAQEANEPPAAATTKELPAAPAPQPSPAAPPRVEEIVPDPQPPSALPAKEEAAIVPAAAGTIAGPPSGSAEPGPSGLHGRQPLVRAGKGAFDISAEYRLRTIYVNPLELNGLDAAEVRYAQNRLRTGWLFNWDNKVKVQAEIDLLDGVLAGDNGIVWGDPPYPNEGTSTIARNPNEAGVGVVLKPDTDPLAPSSYTYGLKKIDPVTVRRAWGEVALGAGVLRAGRMASYEGRGILANDGNNDLNRFGTNGRGDTSDRILFGTKPLEIYKAIRSGDPAAADPREDRGLFFGAAYDQVVNDSIQLGGDNANQYGVSAYYLLPEFNVFGLRCRDLRVAGSFAYRGAHDVEMGISILPLELRVGIEKLRLEFQAAPMWGATRELSDALSLMSSKKPVVQDVLALGVMTVADYDVGPVTLTLEFDYASGDDDPRPDTRVTDFIFAEDTSVGLLLFPQVLGYLTARSSAAGNANLNGLGATALPSTRVATYGAFFNAKALFPQVTWHLTDEVFLRGGALFAWTAAPSTDPTETLRREDGKEITDDAVNYNGGKPGDYWGTEFDLRFSAKLWGHFVFDLDGAVLLPGDALQDMNGDAVPSGMVEARLQFRY